MRKPLIPLLLALLVGCGNADLGEEWTAIPEEDFPLVFAPGGLEDGIGRYLRSVRYEHRRPILATWARWTSPGARLPMAELRLDQAGPNFITTMNARYALSWAVESLFEGRAYSTLAKDRDVNLFGAIDYAHVRDREAECLVFFQTWRRKRILNTLMGHYCVPLAPGLTEARIKAALRSLREK